MKDWESREGNFVSVEGLWQQKSDERPERGVGNHPIAERVRPAAAAPQKLSRAWTKQVVWVAFGTVLWVLACLGVRHVFGGGAILLESVLLVLILGTVIGLASLPEL
jgi:hypothetical protein